MGARLPCNLHNTPTSSPSLSCTCLCLNYRRGDPFHAVRSARDWAPGPVSWAHPGVQRSCRPAGIIQKDISRPSGRLPSCLCSDAATDPWNGRKDCSGFLGLLPSMPCLSGGLLTSTRDSRQDHCMSQCACNWRLLLQCCLRGFAGALKTWTDFMHPRYVDLSTPTVAQVYAAPQASDINRLPGVRLLSRA